MNSNRNDFNALFYCKIRKLKYPKTTEQFKLFLIRSNTFQLNPF